MSDLLRRKAEEVFQQAADLPPQQRAVFLDERCADQPAVRAEVESLLVHLDNEMIASLACAASILPQDAIPGNERIGPYKILRLIGEGGFGSVFLAEQEQPVHREVALKIIKLGMDTRQVIARFEAERQALAMMDHPSIARVLDAGATDTGRPYFVMELVRGTPITECCDRNGLSTRARLRLFVQVCHAVQHAHQKGVIHRDIKPSNVLVVLHDGTPAPKIIDFGIAKATNQRLTDRTFFTVYLRFIGTPQYMSPEQAAMHGADIDTRTDVYSLGVLLYELLTGTTPCEAAALRNAGTDKIQQIICQQDPPTPSQRLSALGGDLREVASARSADPKALTRLVRGDLDWIVMKALEKDRNRRYETVAALAADVQHYLDNEPVAARPPNRSYRFRKFVRRNRISFVAGSLVAVAILIGLAAATIGFVRARDERDRALAAEQRAGVQADRARVEAQSAKAINQFFNKMLASVDPMQIRALSAYALDENAPARPAGSFPRDVSVARMVREAAATLDRAFAGKPELEAASRETLGMTLRGLGLFRDAAIQLEAALEIRRRVLGDEHPDTLRSALALGDILADTGKSSQAERLVRAAHAGLRRVYGDEHPKVLSAAAILASVLADQRNFEESEALYDETLRAQLRVLGPEHRDTLVTMWRWACSCLPQWKLNEGRILVDQVRAIAANALSPDDPLNILTGSLMGWVHLNQFQYAEAEPFLATGLEDCRRILGPQHPFTYMTMHGLARALRGSDRQEQKEHLYHEALTGLRDSRGQYHWHTLMVTLDLARFLERRGRIAEAEQMYRAFVDGYAGAFGEEHLETRRARSEFRIFLEKAGRTDEAVSVIRENLDVVRRHADAPGVRLPAEFDQAAHWLVNLGRIDEARALSQELLDYLRDQVAEHGDDPGIRNDYACALLVCVPPDLRDVEAALPLAEQAVEMSEGEVATALDTLALAYHLTGQDGKAVATQRRAVAALRPIERGTLLPAANLVRYLRSRGDTAAADRAVEDNFKVFREALGENNATIALRYYEAGLRLRDAGHYAMAQRAFRIMLELNREALGQEHEETAESLARLAGIDLLQGDHEEAVAKYEEVLAMRRRLLGDSDTLVADTMRYLGMAQYAAGDVTQAESTLRDALRIYQDLDVDDIPAAVSARRHLAELLVGRGELVEAGPLARSALKTTRARYGDAHLRTARSLHTLGWLLTEAGEAAEAELVLDQCLRSYDRLDLPESQTWLRAQAECTMGYCLLTMQRYEEAEPLLLHSYSEIQTARGDDDPSTCTALNRIIALYDAWDKPAQASRWRTKA